jgi:hypothetical protein
MTRARLCGGPPPGGTRSCAVEKRCLSPCLSIVLFSVIACSTVAGCAYSQRYVVSIPTVEGTGLSFVQEKNPQRPRHIIELPRLQLSVKPFNARLVSTFNSWFWFIPVPFDRVYPEAERFEKHDQSADPPFLIEVAFHPLAVDLSIEPSQITLHLAGQIFKPTSMIPPSDLRSFDRPTYHGLSLCRLQHNLRLIEVRRPLQAMQIPAGEKICIWLRFDVGPPTPETEYAIFVDGIKMAGKPIQIPVIRFVSGVAYEVDRVM